MSNNFSNGFKKILLGATCIVASPIVVGIVASSVATVGAFAVVSGVASEGAVIATGLTAMGAAEKAMIKGGTLIVKEGASEMSE